MDNNSTPQSVIAAEAEIIGTIKSTGSVRLDGKLEGELHCTGDAVIGKSANIKGNLTVSSVSVEGAIHGNIIAKDRIELKSSARVHGDIKAKRLSVEDGVTFIGKSEVNPTGSTVSETPAPESSEESGGSEHADAASVRSFARR